MSSEAASSTKEEPLRSMRRPLSFFIAMIAWTLSSASFMTTL